MGFYLWSYNNHLFPSPTRSPKTQFSTWLSVFNISLISRHGSLKLIACTSHALKPSLNVSVAIIFYSRGMATGWKEAQSLSFVMFVLKSLSKLILSLFTYSGICYTLTHSVCNFVCSTTFKGSRRSHSVKVSLWYASLLTNTRFRFLNFRISDC